jgi:membrane-associated phospholipid phosphatase
VLKNSITQKFFFFFSISACCILCFFFVDYPLILWLNENNTGFIKKLFEYITLLGDGFFAFIVILLLFGISLFFQFFSKIHFSVRQRWRQIFFEQSKALFIYLILGGLVVRFLKISVGRYRPPLFLETGIQGFDFFRIENQYASFPSGHTQTAATLMLLLAVFYPKYRWLFYFLFFIAAISRIVLLAHYPSDVLMGAYIGILFGIFAKNYYRKKTANL